MPSPRKGEVRPFAYIITRVSNFRTLQAANERRNETSENHEYTNE